MTTAKSHAFRLSSNRCSTCEDLRRLKARIEAAHGKPRTSYRAAMKATDSAALQNLEEELKQTSAAHMFICYAVDGHLTNQRLATPRDPRSKWRDESSQ